MPKTNQTAEDLFGNTFLVFPRNMCHTISSPTSPACHVDFVETPDSYLLKAELAGFLKQDIHITTEKNILTISAEKKKEEEKETDVLYVKERRFGKVERSLRIPDDCDIEQVQANYANGLLELTFKKKTPTVSKKVQIS